jgi:DUF1680 family protein
MPIQIHLVHPKVKSCSGKAALSRGPIVYCLEGVYNPNINLETVSVDQESLHPIFDPDLFGGVMIVIGKTVTGKDLKFIPYAWWVNRDPSPMTVFLIYRFYTANKFLALATARLASSAKPSAPI